MTADELNALSIDDIQLILSDQQDLYSKEEIDELKEHLKYLLGEEPIIREAEKINQRPKEFTCPKCGATNQSTSDACEYCGYAFREPDYYSDWDTNDDSDSNTSLYIISFLLPIVGIILGIVYIGKGQDDLGKSLILFSIVISMLAALVGAYLLYS